MQHGANPYSFLWDNLAAEAISPNYSLVPLQWFLYASLSFAFDLPSQISLATL